MNNKEINVAAQQINLEQQLLFVFIISIEFDFKL